MNSLEFLTTVLHDAHHTSASRKMSTGHKSTYERTEETCLSRMKHDFYATEIRPDKKLKKSLDPFRNQIQKHNKVISISIDNYKERIPHSEQNNSTSSKYSISTIYNFHMITCIEL